MKIATDKQAIRREMRQRRRDFVAQRSGQLWTLTEDHFGDLLDSGVTLTSYHAYGDEADPAPIGALARSYQAIIAWPRVDGDGLMRFYALGPSRSLDVDSAGMVAPGKDACRAQPDIILLPLVAFDRTGTRLGQGGGHYDRALAALDAQGHRPIRIGIAWSAQEHPGLPRDPWDMPLDHIITEQEWITP